MFAAPIFFVIALKAMAAPVALSPEVKAKLTQIAFQAARSDDVKTLTEFFRVGGDVNGKNPRGDTLLIVAAYAGQADAVTAILKQKRVRIDATNSMGLTALTAAAFKGDVAVAKLLIAAKANVNHANASQQTSLMYAAMTGKLEMVKCLVESGATIDVKNEKGQSPISLAKQQGATDVVTWLESQKKP
jgi:uncharacterized protein